MDKMQDVAVIVGSLRKDSINRKVANALAELAPAGLKLSIIEIGQLPIYNQDGDENPPAEWRFVNASGRPTLFSSSRPSITARCLPHSRTRSTLVRGPMARAHGAASRAPLSVLRRAVSADLASTTICGSRLPS